jgi:hypothetical protein
MGEKIVVDGFEKLPVSLHEEMVFISCSPSNTCVSYEVRIHHEVFDPDTRTEWVLVPMGAEVLG